MEPAVHGTTSLQITQSMVTKLLNCSFDIRILGGCLIFALSASSISRLCDLQDFAS